MNNKRIIFYLISLFVLMSFYVIYVWAAGADTTEGLFRVTINNITSINISLNRYNITTGYNLNLTCTAERSNNGSIDYVRKAVISNISLYHNLNGSTQITLNRSNTTNATQDFNELGINSTFTRLSGLFKVFNSTRVSFNENGALTSAAYPTTDGNYTIACAGATNNTGTFNFSSNITLVIDRARPNISITTLNVTDGTNVVTYDLMNGTLQGSPKAFLRNSTTLELKISITEPHLDAVKLYWLVNGSPTIPVHNVSNSMRNPDNATLNFPHVSFNSKNVTVANGSFVYAGNGTGNSTEDSYRYAQLMEGRKINFWLVANDSAGNIVNITNNGKGFNFTLDGSQPTVTFSVDKTKINILETIKATCSANDTSEIAYKITLTKPSGAQVVKNPLDGKATFTGTDMGQAGKYTVDCEAADSVGYKTTKSAEVTAVYDTDEGSSLISEEEEEVKKVAEVDLSKQVGETPIEGKFSGIKGEITTFTLDGETQHTLTFLDIGSQEVTLRFESTPVDVILKIGETKEVDLNADGKNDVMVTLNGITDGDADVTVKPIKQMPTTITEETPTKIQDTTESETEKPSKTGMVVLVIVILVVIVLAYFLLKGKKNKKGEIRFTSKDLASEFNF